MRPTVLTFAPYLSHVLLVSALPAPSGVGQLRVSAVEAWCVSAINRDLHGLRLDLRAITNVPFRLRSIAVLTSKSPTRIRGKFLCLALCFFIPLLFTFMHVFKLNVARHRTVCRLRFSAQRKSRPSHAG